MAHRGPDERGFWQDDRAALGVARLSIIDVASGHQPVFSVDKSVVAVCNGEIYNSRYLADQLTRQGVPLRSRSDVEVIPHLYRQHGLEFVRRLRGMFAIALWDSGKQRLVLARDRVGEKPLMYAQHGDGLIFASEARALLAAGWRGEADLQALDHVLAFGYPPITLSGWTGMHAIPPGHVGVWQAGRLQIERYWEWSPGDYVGSAGLGEAVESTLEEAVKVRLISERPIGAFLSGGIDSTIVTALMARHHSGQVKTFSVGFDDPTLDESGHARSVADYLGTDHTEVIARPDPVAIFERLAETYDQPFADSSAIPTLILSDIASRDVVVALSGDGGDEGFAGYVRYEAAPLLQRLNPLLPATAMFAEPLSRLAESLGQSRIARLFQHMTPKPNLDVRYRELMEYQPSVIRQSVWTRNALASADPVVTEQTFMSTWASLAAVTPLARMRATDIVTYLPGDLLAKVDMASMAHSLEVRSPFLDQDVLALASRIPDDLLIRRRKTKWILRQLAYRLVPRQLVDRPKRGFAIPQAAWLRGPLRDMSRDLLLDNVARQRGWFDVSVAARLLDEHQAGANRDRYIWPMLMIENWARRWLDRTSLPSTQ